MASASRDGTPGDRRKNNAGRTNRKNSSNDNPRGQRSAGGAAGRGASGKSASGRSIPASGKGHGYKGQQPSTKKRHRKGRSTPDVEAGRIRPVSYTHLTLPTKRIV